MVIHGTLATAAIQFHVDVNIGDPLWPPAGKVDLPRVLGGPPIRLRGYRIELILAEKIVTAMQRGTANTRWRDFVDVVSLADQRFDVDTTVESLEVDLHVDICRSRVLVAGTRAKEVWYESAEQDELGPFAVVVDDTDQGSFGGGTGPSGAGSLLRHA